MRIAAFSDIHGRLKNKYPKIEDGTDVICIAGDIVPLDIQRNIERSESWFQNDFILWVKELDVKKVIFIAGNHDFYFQRVGVERINEIIKESGLEDKLIYLQDSGYEYNDIKFYGTPWIEQLRNWAFYTPDSEEQFSKIPDCDILITHSAPNVLGIGCSFPGTIYERNYGSSVLTNVISDRDIKINICGHIHSGTHGGIEFGNTEFYNVSLINEDYEEMYPVTYFEYA